MKTIACGKRTNGYPHHSAHARRGPERECVILRDLTDCLLQAYDCVSRRAYERFLERGASSGGEIEDWLDAEREILPGLVVDIEESEKFVYALASVPIPRSAAISIAIESRWLLILGHSERESSSVGFGTSVRGGGAAPGDGHSLPVKSFSVVELPAEVDPRRSIAVRSDGLVAVRMPKGRSGH